jgi:hypothetical protein
MGLHKIKKLLHNKRNCSKVKRPLASYTSDKGLITRGAQKPKLSPNQWANKEMSN